MGIAQKMQEIMTQLRDIEESMSIARSHIGFADQPKNVRDEILKNIIKTTKSEQIRQLAKGVLLGY